MRRCRTVVVGLSAVTATAVLAAGLQHARAAQTRGTLQVSVQVTAPCAASLGATGQLALAAGCARLSAPFAVVAESAVPSLPADLAESAPQAEITPETDADIRFITLIY
jgi:hypothetical protein